MAEHKIKGGRLRPETANQTGGIARGICAVCAKPKAAHFQGR